MDPNRLVVQQDDSEGNRYRVVLGVDDNTAYLPENGWCGDVKPQVDTDGAYSSEDLADASYLPCVVIYPIN